MKKTWWLVVLVLALALVSSLAWHRLHGAGASEALEHQSRATQGENAKADVTTSRPGDTIRPGAEIAPHAARPDASAHVAMPGTDSRQPIPAKSGAQAGGPAPMSDNNAALVDGLVKEIAAYDLRVRDFDALARNEAQDPAWSERMEQLLEQSIRIHGAHMSGLQMRAPHCSRTVCKLVAVGSASTEDPNADWNTLTREIMNEPWFPQNFDDTSSAMKPAPDGILYVAFFIRKT